MNRLVGLSILVVAMTTAGSLAAQETGSAESKAASEVQQTPAAAETTTTSAAMENPRQQEATSAQPAAEQSQAPAVVEATKQAGDTHVRIVRLSQTQGKVGMDRGMGKGAEIAIQNMPIVEGILLGTADRDSYAEVEFEDGSALRLGQGTAVKFSQLVSRATGAKATTVRMDRGTVYVNRENTKSADEFSLVAGGTKKITVMPATHMRVELTGTKAAIAVFSGEAAVDGSNGTPAVVGKKQTLALDVSDGSGQVELAKKVEEGPFDEWDKDALKYHQQYAKGNSLVGGGGYGVSDLFYYGGFSTVDGCGTFWQPYFVSASWSPYGNGMWAMYPGAGYSWVSPYPWGWLPFHSGAWSYCPSRGWGWQPGGAWRGLNNIAGATPIVRGAPAHIPGGLLPRPPADAKASLVVTNQQPLVVSKQDSAQSFVFRRDSAGLGVPRGSLGKLKGVSNDVMQHGFANRNVYVAPAGSSSRWTDGAVYHGPLSLHKGLAPDEAREAMWARQQQRGAASASLSEARTGQNRGSLNAATQQQPGQNGAAGWQGRQGQNAGLSGSGWKGQQEAAGNPSAASANNGRTWNGGNGVSAANGSGRTWNGNNGAGAGNNGSGRTWSGNGGSGAASGGGRSWGGGGSGGGSAGASRGGGGGGSLSGGGAGGGGGNGGGGRGGASGSSSGGGSK